MLDDRYGLELSTASAAARDAYVAGVDGLLAATAGTERHLERALEADPEFALGHIALGRALLLVANVPAARKASAQARDKAMRATPREQSHINAIALGIEGNPVGSLEATRTHLAQYPRDAMVLAPATGVFGLIGFSGRVGREPELYDFLAGFAKHYGEDWWYLSMLAFAAVECGRLDEAQDQIERSLTGNPRSAHSAHVKVHVLYEKGEERAGLDYLEGWMPALEREALLHCHLSWHVALFALALGDTARAWRAYKEGVHTPGGSWGPPLNVATDSASFLWRAELAGEPRRAELWRDSREYGLKWFPKASLSFADVHVALACAADGDAANLERILGELRERQAANRLPAGPVVPALVEGFAAFARRDWDGAIRHLESALAETVRIGGSRAQRDLVNYTLMAAHLRAGRAADAQRFARRNVKAPVS